MWHGYGTHVFCARYRTTCSVLTVSPVLVCQAMFIDPESGVATTALDNAVMNGHLGAISVLQAAVHLGDVPAGLGGGMPKYSAQVKYHFAHTLVMPLCGPVRPHQWGVLT
jgi:hypothetical protein